MKTLKLIYFFTALVPFIIAACNNNQDKKTNNDRSGSFEVKGNDTVNVINSQGKQGKWVPSVSNKLKDTTYYRNDTIIEK